MATLPETASLDQLCEELYGVQSVREAWRVAVATIADKAKATLPECNGRVESAVKIVLAGDVALLPDGTATVGSQRTADAQYHVVNGTCDCRDYEKAPHHFCKHRLARALVVRATQTMAQTTEDMEHVPCPRTVDHVPAVDAPADIPQHFLVSLHGKQFVTYAGLLALAHQRGLVSLTARFISVTPDCALAEATAVFRDGRTFTEAADASPGNVGAKVKASFPRMALTRAKARCLRDALNIGMCSLEEVE